MNDNDMIITNVINEGNQNNVKICINADTYLEKIFSQKCASDNRKIRNWKCMALAECGVWS